MTELSFRFYAGLNDFLPSARRGRRFTHVVRGRASVKDTIEALGVPHPEVDLILANGRAVGFEYRPDPGDLVSVYPAFRSIELAGVHRVGSDPPAPARFLLDLHLGKLASYLRLAGFDASTAVDDAHIAQSAGGEGRIVLTRDLALLKRAAVQHGYWVRHTDPERQFAEILERFDLAGRMTPFTRCLRCNLPVVAVDLETIAGRLPPRVKADEGRRYHRCPGCDRIYWKGSHVERLQRVLDRARQDATLGTATTSTGAWTDDQRTEPGA